MSAMLMISAVDKYFGTSPSVADVFQMPTIRHLSNVIQGKEQAENQFKTVLCLQPPLDGSSESIFIVPAAGGLAFPQFYIAEALGSSAAVYCFQDPALVDNKPMASSLEAMAAGWLHDMRSIQPSGPYNLVGWSYGAVVAFEMAQQVYAEGEQVSSLWMLDPMYPDPSTQKIGSRMCFWASVFHPQNADQWRDACFVRSRGQQGGCCNLSCFGGGGALERGMSSASAANKGANSVIPKTGRMFELLASTSLVILIVLLKWQALVFVTHKRILVIQRC